MAAASTSASASSAAHAAGSGGPAVLFRVAGGHRLGFGHIVRAMSLAKAIGVTPRLSVRGTADARQVAKQLGAEVDTRALDEILTTRDHALVVIDDPNARAADQALRAIRRHARHATAGRGGTAVAVASVHDLGIAPIASDLAIDGSIATVRRRWPAAQALLGPQFAVLDEDIAGLRAYRDACAPHTSTMRVTDVPEPHEEHPRIVISLGGGRRAGLAWRLGYSAAMAYPDVQVIVAGGFTRASRAPRGEMPKTLPNLRPLRAPQWLRLELARASVAIVAGGVTLYEAAALGVPAVALAVVPAQRPTIAAFARLGAASAAGNGSVAPSSGFAKIVAHVAREVDALLGDDRARERMAAAGRAAIDGLGAQRVAAALHELIAEHGQHAEQPQAGAAGRSTAGTAWEANRAYAGGGSA